MEKINNYQFLRNKENELGRGSYSIVYGGKYIGQDNSLIKFSTKVAIKVIKTKNLTEKAKNILEDEIKIMKMIKYDPHPNIVGCYDIETTNDEIFIIMEYCDSGDLRSILQKPIKEKFAQFYFCQLANGLKYLDKNCIIHRDIKPKNILLTNTRRVLKIADFGFAKKIQKQSLHDTFCGSPLYMAPEIMNNNLYNNQTDLWSIGLILYEMLYGFHPLNSCKTLPELKDTVKGINIEIPPASTKNKDVSEKCLSLLKKLLQKKASDRITWEEFFDHSWVKAFQYVIPKSNNRNEEYEKQLYSVSLGSLSKDDTFDIISSSPKNNNLGSTPTIKTSCLNITIIDDFIDNHDDKIYNNKNKDNKDNKDTKNNKEDDLIFEMDFDDSPETKNKKIIVRKITEKSSVLTDNDNKYDIIDYS